jgi:hypothetical protein
LPLNKSLKSHNEWKTHIGHSSLLKLTLLTVIYNSFTLHTTFYRLCVDQGILCMTISCCPFPFIGFHVKTLKWISSTFILDREVFLFSNAYPSYTHTVIFIVRHNVFSIMILQSRGRIIDFRSLKWSDACNADRFQHSMTQLTSQSDYSC